ncbi:hypothetical protein CAEBREN_02602 [Caenorhabditis brenneri]|uniref:Sdz-33 F-box domain-containing protein n=1 Tax=Caenorhabditis brenneri TaxID=135651 RepID=G0MC78_CAEBE|nr:hypothetical protein CAEBREN_02602 [Caenorhabditis brenneri]
MLLSMLSKRTMNLVKWLKLELKHFTVDLQERVCLHLEFKDYDIIEIDLDTNGNSDDFGMLTSDVIVVRLIAEGEVEDDIHVDWEYPNMRDWIDHLQYIFSYNYVDLSFFELRTLCYSFESIVKTLEGTPIRILQAADKYDVFRRVLHYFPTPRLLNLLGRVLPVSHPAPCSKFMAKLLIQNFNALYFYSSIPITLNSLLIMNAPFLRACAPTLSDRELNMYVRLWMNNTASKLEYLDLDYDSFDPDEHRPFRIFDKDVILKGINYIERPIDLKRVFQFSIDFHSFGLCVGLYGGYDVTRQDGTTCSVFIRTERPLIKLVVWP